MLLEFPRAGAGPGTHAFVVGVSHYPFADGPEATDLGQQFGLSNLSGAAHSAAEVAAWLMTEYRNPTAPLASITLLLSPVPGETLHPAVEARLPQGPTAATRDAVEVAFNRFRTTCRSDEDNVAFVYVAGHGIQLNKRGAVVLLHDFATRDRDALYGALDMAGCRDAMDETGNARRQVWFSDACRQRPDVVRRFEVLTGAYRPSEGQGQVDSSPMFLASSSRESAFAEVGGLTIFSQALLWALRGAAATGPAAAGEEWHVPATKLIQLLPERVRELLAGVPEQQQVDVTGRVLEMPVHYFEQAPATDLEVTFTPEDLDPRPTAELLFGAQEPCVVDQSWPLRFRGAAGLYLLRVAVPQTPRMAQMIINVAPPACRTVIQVPG